MKKMQFLSYAISVAYGQYQKKVLTGTKKKGLKPHIRWCKILLAMKINTQKIKLELERIEKDLQWLADEMGMTRQGAHSAIHSAQTLALIEKIGLTLGIDPKDLII
jgi:hypothetical protein